MGSFNIPLRTNGKENQVLALNNIINNFIACSNCRIHVFSKRKRTLIKIDHLLYNINTFQRIEIIYSMFSDQNEVKLEFYYRSRKYSYVVEIYKYVTK